MVIVDGADPGSDFLPVLIRILREGVGTSVIELNPQESTMCVLRGERRLVKEVKDLVKAIEWTALT